MAGLSRQWLKNGRVANVAGQRLRVMHWHLGAAPGESFVGCGWVAYLVNDGWLLVRTVINGWLGIGFGFALI